MFTMEVRGSLMQRTEEHLKWINSPQRALDFMADIGEQLIRDNRYERQLERGANGRRLRPWKVRKGVYKGALGPTLAPFGDDSRSIDWFAYDITQRRTNAANEYILSVGWEERGRHHRDKPGGPFGLEVLRMHARGIKYGRRFIRRDIFGATPLMRRSVKRLMREHRIKYKDSI